MSPRIIATTASGDLVTNQEYLKQTSRTPFQAGRVLESPGGVLYGYSGMIDFDAARAASYDMIAFTLERDAVLKMSFACDWDVLASSNDAVGVVVNIGDVAVIRQVSEHIAEETAPPVWPFDFFLPAARTCDIKVLNPDGGVSLLQANVTLLGKYV